MKVLYAIQGTGNGHLSRAIALLPKLKERFEVDVLISGIQADIQFPFEVKYSYKGLSFIFGKNGNIDYLKTIIAIPFFKTWLDIAKCPVKSYDLVINDFEPITAWACKLKNVPCFSVSHQSALLSKNTPRPNYKDYLFEWILKYYAPTKHIFGFHFEKYDENIYFPIIREVFRTHKVTNEGHYTVYLPAYSDEKIHKVLSKIPQVNWQVFSKHTDKDYILDNIQFQKVNLEKFEKSLLSCTGIICGAGFETPAEALFLNKKLLVIPMKGQYEQQCNAQSLKEIGITTLKKLNLKRLEDIIAWVIFTSPTHIEYQDETSKIVDDIYKKYQIIAL